MINPYMKTKYPGEIGNPHFNHISCEMESLVYERPSFFGLKNILPPHFNPKFPNHPWLTRGYFCLRDRDNAIKSLRKKGYDYFVEYRDVNSQYALMASKRMSEHVI